ncbi:Protein RALF-like 4 [Linum perenne]
MAPNFWPILILLATVVAATSESVVSSLAEEERGMQVHDFNRESDQFMMDSETNHRMLVQRRQRYITYRALAANNIPCGWKEGRYYDCNEHERANLYRRGCTAATGCYRWTH